ALIRDDDAQPLVQERELAQAVRERVERVVQVREDFRVRLEGDARTRRLRLADDLEIRALDAARIALAIDLAATLNLDLEPLGQRVHHAHADAVQTARHLVAALVELAA